MGCLEGCGDSVRLYRGCCCCSDLTLFFSGNSPILIPGVFLPSYIIPLSSSSSRRMGVFSCWRKGKTVGEDNESAREDGRYAGERPRGQRRRDRARRRRMKFGVGSGVASISSYGSPRSVMSALFFFFMYIQYRDSISNVYTYRYRGS